MCEDCKRSAVALQDIRKELMISNGYLARLLAHLGVSPAPTVAPGGVLDLLEPWLRPADADTPPTD